MDVIGTCAVYSKDFFSQAGQISGKNRRGDLDHRELRKKANKKSGRQSLYNPFEKGLASP
jgi:hypothetical protein